MAKKKFSKKAQTGLDNKKKKTTTSDAFTDLGSRMSNALYTFGGSAIGDAVRGAFGKDAAEAVDYYSGGLIPYTTDKHLKWGREHDAYENITGQTVPAASLAGGIATGVKGGQMVYKGLKPVAKYAGDKIMSLFGRGMSSAEKASLDKFGRDVLTEDFFEEYFTQKYLGKRKTGVDKLREVYDEFARKLEGEKILEKDMRIAQMKGKTQHLQKNVKKFNKPLTSEEASMVYDVDNMINFGDAYSIAEQAHLTGDDFYRATRNAINNIKTPILNTALPAGVVASTEEPPELCGGGKNRKRFKKKRKK